MKISVRREPGGETCCHEVYVNGEYTGHWCRKTGILAVDGEVVDFFSSAKDIRDNLAQKVVARVTFCKKAGK